MAAVPFPSVAWPVGEKVRCALVFHTLRETQQHSEVVVGGLGGIGCAVGTGRETGMVLGHQESAYANYNRPYVQPLSSQSPTAP